ncbi:MAG TPA: ATP-binding protein [Pyrinomonadaceae bacterium]|jgi:signal transduction histidine kinase|nr:ATP-binding protein [Pyrinomonadaceae bacterium]
MGVLSKVFRDVPRAGVISVRRAFNSRLIILFTILTVVLTATVIVTWEQLLRPPYFSWVERNYPGPENADYRYKLEQRVEHFFISMTVDVIVVSILLAIVDHKQRRLVVATEQLAHSEKVATLGRVAAQVAHEVRNPLAGLLLYSVHLKGKLEGKLPNGDAQLIDKIIETINHLTATTEQILNYARPVTLAPKRVDLNEVAKDVIQLLSTEVSAHNIDTQVNLNNAPVAGMLDEASIRAATLNLMLNAIQAMSTGGRLTVSTGRDDGHLWMIIRDTGTGMTAEQIKQIFEPFNTTKSRGLGLGMPYAQKVIQQHGGQIAVDSRPGNGTQVKIELPANGGVN